MHYIPLFFHTYKKLFLAFIVVCCVLLLCAPYFAHAGWTDCITSISGGFDCAFRPVAWIVYALSLAIGGLIAGIGALLLDLSVYWTVVRMGFLLQPTNGLGVGVQQLWVVLRDILNIVFIFGLIYIGIKTILDAEDSGTRKTLGYLIVAALLINFSLYITQVVVDFTNITAVQVYNQIVASGLSDGYTDGNIDLDNKSITGTFLNVANISSFFGADTISDVAGITTAKILAYSIFMMIFLIVAGIVFAMGAFMLITRFIALTLYMIFSPLMFAGWIFPAFAGAQKKWWGGFLKQAFFAPAFLFMIYLSLVVLTKLREVMKISEGGSYADIMKGAQMESGAIVIILFFCMMIGFLYASIKVGSMMGIAGAEGSMKALSWMGKTARSTAGGATLGLAARTGRASAGMIAQRMADDKNLQDRQGMKGWSGRYARGKLAAAKYVGDSSFDLRRTGVLGKELGEGKKGGYKTQLAELEKKEKTRAESFGEVGDDDTRVKEMKEVEHHLEDELATLKRQREDASKEDKGAIDILIKEKQEEIKLQQENIIHEKNRRQIGAYADPATAAGTKVAYAKAAKEKNDAAQGILDQVKIAEDVKTKLALQVKAANAKLAAETDVINARAAAEIEKEELLINDDRVNEDEKLAARKRINTTKEESRTRLTEAKAVATADIKTAEEEAETNIKTARTTIKTQGKILKEQNKAIKELRKQAQKEAADQGYAGVLEQSSFMGSAIFGRTVGQDLAAGKAVRKQFTKGRLKEEAHKHDDKAHAADHGHDAHAPTPKPASAPVAAAKAAPAAGGHDAHN